MSRQLKPQIVGQIRHTSTRLNLPLYLNRNDLTFYAEIGPIKFVFKTPEEVRKAALAHLDKAGVKVEWTPIIEVAISRAEHWGSHRLGLDVDRYYLGKQERDGDAFPVILKVNWGDFQIRRDSLHLRTTNPEEINEDMERISRADRWHPRGAVEIPRLPQKVNEGEWLIEYTPEMWGGLMAIQDGIKKLGTSLSKLIGQGAGRERIATLGKNKPKLLTI